MTKKNRSEPVGAPLHQRIQRDPGLVLAVRARSRLLSTIRAHFAAHGFLEVSTPSLVTAPDPALHLESFASELVLDSGQRSPVYLPTSPEFCMKRMVAAGFSRIYQICPFFRNGELTPRHNPEFAGLEWYQVGLDIDGLMDFTEDLVRRVTIGMLGGTCFEYQGQTLDLGPSFRRLSVAQALRELAEVPDLPPDFEEPALRRSLERAGIRTAPDDGFDDLIHRAMIERVEPKLPSLGPVLLFDYPAPMAALARLRPKNPTVAERFELYTGGLELCNGYGELTDPVEQRRRFEDQRAARSRLGRTVPPLDEAFLEALEHGLPPCSGCALGVDRLLMLLLGRDRIDEVLAFPLGC